jgi:hypothetical protein
MSLGTILIADDEPGMLEVLKPSLIGHDYPVPEAQRRDVSNYCWKTGAGPLIRFHFRLTFTSTRLAILMKGMPLFIP